MKYLPKNINRVLLLNKAEDIDGSILTFILRLDKAFFSKICCWFSVQWVDREHLDTNTKGDSQDKMVKIGRQNQNV